DLYSSVELKGGTLTLNNGSGTFFNEAGNTLKFSANNGKMGKLDGNLENTNGSVVVNVAGVDLKQEHILITGYASGVDSQTLSIEVAQGQTSDLVEAHINKGANNKLGLIVMEKGATPPSLQNQNPQNPGGNGSGSQNPSTPGSGGNSGNQGGGSNSGGGIQTPDSNGNLTIMDTIQQDLPSTQGAILGGLRDIMPNLATSVANSTQLKSFVSNVESQTQNISQAPAKVIDTIKSTRNFKPVTNFSSTRQAREAVKVASVATDSMGGINYRDISTYDPLNTTTIWSNEIDVALFGLGLSGDGTDGSMIGLNASVQKEVSDNHLLKGQLSYAYAYTKDDLETINSKTDTNVLSGGILNRFTYDNIETDIGVYATAAFSDNTQEYKIAGILSNADSSYEFYSGELEAIVGYRFGDEFSIKPYIGVNNSYNYRTGIKQNGGVLMRADSQKYYAIDGILGAEAQYNLQSGYVYGKLEHYRTLYYSNDSMKFRLGNSDMIELLMDKDFKTTASLGFMYYYNEFINLGLETMYSIYNGGLKNYGGSLMFKYLF
ncbi:MAG: autotransporter outer membrane beta-barrel domain-containing protein, partial [Helicobacteraceae bacterium]|nr:autotransporter outer membrane beta-barrel domain-containing protein [Helicobacteraceae bacterium]